ncbi:MAG: O-antigen ligase family protein [Clostridia bacterium]|nr:O-antigen ligase family protein [Clostridia bacterium]
MSFFLCALLGLFLLGILFRTPELLTLGIVFFLPFFSLFEHAGLILCGAVLLADLAWLWKAACGRRRLRFGWIDFIFLFFTCLVLFGGLFGAGGGDSIKSGLIRFALLTFWFPTTDFFTQNLWRKRGITAIKCAGFLASVWGIGQYFLTHLELLWVDVSRFSDIGGRVCGPFSNPNIFAVFLVLIAPLFLVGAMDATRSIVIRCCNGLGFLSVALCTVFTWSRGAWLGLLVAVFLILVSYSRTSVAVSILSVLPIGVFATYLPHSVINRFSSIGSFSESSIRYRFYTWKGVMRMIEDFAWGIGVGESSFSAVYPRYALSGIETVMHAHQLFLQIFLELGICGLIVFLLFLLQLSLSVFGGLKNLHGDARAELLGCTGSVLGVLVMGLFDYVWYHLGMFCLFFIFCSLIAVKRETEDSAYETSIYL